jgi:hypothetical protein
MEDKAILTVVSRASATYDIHRFSKKMIGASPQTPIIKLSNESNKLIPEATDGHTTLLIVVEPVSIAIAIGQEAVPGKSRR